MRRRGAIVFAPRSHTCGLATCFGASTFVVAQSKIEATTAQSIGHGGQEKVEHVNSFSCPGRSAALEAERLGLISNRRPSRAA